MGRVWACPGKSSACPNSAPAAALIPLPWERRWKLALGVIKRFMGFIHQHESSGFEACTNCFQPWSPNSASTIEISSKVLQNVLPESRRCSSQTSHYAYLDIIETVMHTWPHVQKCPSLNFNTGESTCACGQALRRNHSGTDVKILFALTDYCIKLNLL